VTVGEEKGQISQNQIALVPTMVPHDLRNVGQERAKVLGFFGAAIVYLEPGDYALIDTVPSKDGTPHVNRGMAKAVTVTNTQVGVEPTAELTVDMLDFAYTLSEPLKAGQYNIRVNNQGEQPHEIFLARLQPNKGVEDLLASLAPDAPLEAIDWQALGGISVIEPGAHGYFPVDLAPGKYALLCFAPDHGSGMPNFMKGMAQEFVIE
jgi:hypothetical protein